MPALCSRKDMFGTDIKSALGQSNLFHCVSEKQVQNMNNFLLLSESPALSKALSD